jgi:hypothetical protein
MVAWVDKIGDYRVERRPISGGAAMPTVRAVGLHATDGSDVDTAHSWQMSQGYGVHSDAGQAADARARDFAAKVVGFATETALSSESLGVKRSGQAELNGARSGMVGRIMLDNGTRVLVTVAVRQK